MMKLIAILIQLLIQINFGLSSSKSHLSHKLKGGKGGDEDDEPLKEGPLSIKANQKKSMDDFGINFYNFLEIYKNHRLTLGEIKHIYNTADMNRDNTISPREWKMFYKLFVMPFERCDEDQDYALNSKELQKCFDSKYLNDTLLTKDNVTYVMNVMDRNDNNNPITFIDYIFLRRVNLAWKECTTDSKLSVSKLDCALQITVPGRRVDLPEAHQVFRVLLFLENGKYTQLGVIIKLTDFLYISHLFYYFSAFELPFLDGYLNRKDVLRAIENQQLASSLTPNIINSIFENDKEEIDFMHFASVIYIYQLFQRYSQGNSTLNLDNWVALLTNKVPELPQDVLDLINNNFQQDEEQAALSDKVVVTKGEAITEKDFLINFLQFNQKIRTINKNKNTNNNYNKQFYRFLESKGGKQKGVDPKVNAEVFFKIMDTKKLNTVNFADFMQGIKFIWTFYNFDTDQNGFLVDHELREGLAKQNMPFSFNVREKTELNECLQYLNFGGSYRINLKEFLDFQFYNQMFFSLKSPGTMSNCLDSDLKKGFDQLGLIVTNKTIKASQDGYDETIGLPLYNYVQAFKTTIEKEIVSIRLFGINVTDEDTLNEAKKTPKLF